MAKYLTKKTLVYRLLFPLAVSGIVLTLFIQMLDGPVLGGEYDFLAASRPPPPLAREILVIDTGEGGTERLLSSAVAGQVVLTLTELSASKLILLSPVLGGDSGERAGSTEQLFYFDEEFKTINDNIKNLFDGIRLGSIAPEETPRFVGDVIKLTNSSKERLLQSAVQQVEADIMRLEKAIAVFDGVYVPNDIQVALVNDASAEAVSGVGYTAGYSRAVPDHDGKIRRIAPWIDGEERLEHVVWTALKQTKPADWDIASLLDSTGSLIFELPGTTPFFRTIPLSLFLDYEDLDKTLYKLLAAELSLASYGGILPDKYPAFLYEKAAEEREKLLQTNEKEQKIRWIEARAAYYRSLADFFQFDIRQNIIASFEKLAKDEGLDESKNGKLNELRDAELQKYDIALEVHRELAAIREKLETALNNAFCILGNAENYTSLAPLNPVQISALLANAIFTEAVITVVDQRDVILRSVVPVVFLILVMLKLRLIASFVMLILSSFVLYAGFCYGFVFTGKWLDPLIPAATIFSAAFTSLFCAAAARISMASRLKLAYAALLSPANLRRLIVTKKPLPEKNKTAFAAIVAVRNPNLNFIENKKDTRTAVETLDKFRNEAKEAFINAGAVIIDCGGEIVVAAFGSPLERLAAAGAHKAGLYNDSAKGWEGSAANKAARLITGLPPPKAKSVPWCFGLDYGECSFSWSPLTGYTAIGRAVARARLLSRLCVRYKVKTLITEEARKKIDPLLTKLVNGKRHSKAGDYFELRS